MLTPPPLVSGYVDVRPASGGHSHEVFLARDERTGVEVVLRVFGARRRGPEAPGLQAAVLRLAAQVTRAPAVIELRAAREGEPAVLVTARLPGVVLDEVLLGSTDADLHRRLGESLGQELARLSTHTLPIVGEFLDESLTRAYWQEGSESLLGWWSLWEHRAPLARLSEAHKQGLRRACIEAEALLVELPSRACLTHGDLSPRNVLCDPVSGEVTGLFDWEFAHAGHPMEDAGHQLRERWQGHFADAMLERLGAGLPAAEQASVDELRRRARAADLYWIIELASRLGQGSATTRCHRILLAIARTGDLAASPQA